MRQTIDSLPVAVVVVIVVAPKSQKFGVTNGIGEKHLRACVSPHLYSHKTQFLQLMLTHAQAKICVRLILDLLTSDLGVGEFAPVRKQVELDSFIRSRKCHASHQQDQQQ